MYSDYPKLYKLVESMTDDECQAFENKFQPESDLKYYQVYQILKIQTKDSIEPDENGYEELKKIESKDLRTLLRDTIKQILEFLDEFHSNLDSNILKLRKLLDRTEYLIQKELFDFANESWQEARDLAIDNKIYDEYPRIFRLGTENNFRSKSPKLKDDIKEFADLAFKLVGSLLSKESSVQVFGNSQMFVNELRTNYLEEYKNLIKSLDKAKEKALQEEVIIAFGLILHYNINDRLNNESTTLAKDEYKNFYQDWFYRLIFTFLCLNKNDNKFYFEVYAVLEDAFKENPSIFLPESEKDDNVDNKSNNWNALIDSPWVNAWWILQNFELFYYSYNSGYYERAKEALHRLKLNFQTQSFTNPMKYSALGYFLTRKIVSLEMMFKLKSGEGLDGIKSISETMPEDLIIFSETQIEKTALRYELNLILIKFLSTYGNGQRKEKQNILTHIRELLNQKKILEKYPNYEGDLCLMELFIEIGNMEIEIDNSLRSLKRFLEKEGLFKDFRKFYFEMLKKAKNPKFNLSKAYNLFKEEIENTREKLNPFHFALCQVIELGNTP